MENEAFFDAYREEADENLQKLNERLVAYEDTGDEEDLHELFRATHTLKSSSQSMGFDTVGELAHAMEDVFDALRNEDIAPDDDLFALLYSGVDTLEAMIQHVEAEQEEPDTDVSDLLKQLKRAEEGKDIEPVEQDETGENAFSDITEIKVDADRLDTLMNATGELLITEKKLRELLTPLDDREVEAAMDRFRRLGEDIQHNVSRARMVPVSQVFDRYPRVVRDIAHELGKDVDFEIEGRELRMDRTVLDEIGEPIIHLLRNAIDHGIEPASEREDAGKNPTGTVRLTAERAGNEAVIAVEDDGAGIDVEQVRETAIENGVVTREEAEDLSRDEVLRLLFNPALSTTEEVTQYSGRGVGLSTVKTTTERLQGTYSIDSDTGKGTRIEMRMPLSLAIVKCFVIEVGERRFGIPINPIRRCISIDQDDIKMLENAEVFLHDGEEVPLIRLGDLFDIETRKQEQYTVVLVRIGQEQAGLVVDAIIDVQDFVIKNIDLVDTEGVAGSSILSDGTPIIILEVSTLLGV